MGDIIQKEVFRIYLSHYIRGPKGNEATQKDIAENIAKHIAIGTEIKAWLIDWEKMDGFPKCDLYIPAEHDEFVQIAYNKSYIKEEQILDVDCNIIRKCSLLIAWGDPSRSTGMTVEVEYAGRIGIPILFAVALNNSTIMALKQAIAYISSGDR